MIVRKTLGVLGLLSITAAAVAAPVEYDTDDFHLVVSRPFDSWSGDASVMDGELDTIRDHRAHFRYFLTERQSLGAGLSLINGTSSDQVTKDTVVLVQSKGFEITQRGGYHWAMGLPTELDPKSYPLLRQAQSAMYDALIRQQGEPDKIPGSMGARRVLGNLLALGAIGVGMNKFGGTGGYVVTNAFAGDIAQLPVKVRQSFAPFDLPPMDNFEISKIEVFPVKVNEGGSPGQVIVAYKTPPTEASRRAAFVLALSSLTGADTTPQAVEAARAADLQRRKDTWNECVSAHQCGDTKGQAAGDGK